MELIHSAGLTKSGRNIPLVDMLFALLLPQQLGEEDLPARLANIVGLLKTYRYAVLAGTMLSAFAMPQWGAALDSAGAREGAIIVAQAPPPNEIPEQRRLREMQKAKQQPPAQKGPPVQNVQPPPVQRPPVQNVQPPPVQRPPVQNAQPPQQNLQPQPLPKNVQPKAVQPAIAQPQTPSVDPRALPKNVQPKNVQPAIVQPPGPGRTTAPPAVGQPVAPVAPGGRVAQPPVGQPQPPAGQPVQPAVGQPVAPGAPGRVVQPPGTPMQPAVGQPVAPVAPGGRVAQPPVGQPQPPGTPMQPAVGQPGAPGSAPFVRPAAVPVNVDALRDQRRERRDASGRIIIEEPGGRMIVRERGQVFIRHDDSFRFSRFGQPAVTRRGVETFNVIRRPDGSEIITVTDANGNLLRRIRRGYDGREYVLIDNRPRVGAAIGVGAAVIGAGLVLGLAAPVITMPRERYIVDVSAAPPTLLVDTLMAPPVMAMERPYTLDEVRFNAPLRDRMPRIDIDTVTFATGSWEVTPDQYAALEAIAQAILSVIAQNPNEAFMIEGHTDAVGNSDDNLSLSDRRAESVAVILTETYMVPPENLVTQGYGEQYLKVPTPDANRQNRRVAVRRITPLLAAGQ